MPQTPPLAIDEHSDPRVPVTLLTGFLGAGKTTLLNKILSDAASGRIAVIVNEFGEAGLDHDLIEEVSGEVVLMQSGCLCCSIRGDLSETFASLLAKRDAGALQFDRVVVETTGLADPGPILQTLLVDPYLARTVRMDGVVTVVDAVNGAHTLDRQFEAVSQVALADLLILSKTDLVAPTQTSRMSERLRDLNPTAQIVRPRDTSLDPNRLWGITGLRASATRKDAIDWTTPKVIAAPLDNLSGLMPKPVAVMESRPHDSGITSISIVLDDPLEDAVFDKWFDTLIAFKGRNILRAKGILFLRGVEKPFAFHGVQTVFDRPVPLTRWTGTDRSTRIVLIGRHLDRPEIQQSLDMLRDASRRAVTPKSQTEVIPHD